MSEHTGRPPFYIDDEEALALRKASADLTPSPRYQPATSFDAFVKQVFIPPTITDLYIKAHQIRLADWEVAAIRHSLFSGGLLASILALKWAQDRSHPPYIRVACSGKGDYDHMASHLSLKGTDEVEHGGDFGAPAVLEIWPSGHYSPIHAHGQTSGILLGLAGQIDIMLYDKLDWNAKKIGLMTLRPGQVCWLNAEHFAVHKVACTMPPHTFGASFHVYINQHEAPTLAKVPTPNTRDIFEFVEEHEPHDLKAFITYADLSWGILRQELSHAIAGLECRIGHPLPLRSRAQLVAGD